MCTISCDGSDRLVNGLSLMNPRLNLVSSAESPFRGRDTRVLLLFMQHDTVGSSVGRTLQHLYCKSCQLPTAMVLPRCLLNRLVLTHISFGGDGSLPKLPTKIMGRSVIIFGIRGKSSHAPAPQRISTPDRHAGLSIVHDVPKSEDWSTSRMSS